MHPPVDAAPRWSADVVVSLAPDVRVLAGAREAALASLWRGLGCDDGAVWGTFHGTAAEPYQVVVTLAGPTYRCTCPSRRRPCKHSLALLLLWAGGSVLAAAPPAFAVEAIGREAAPGSGEPLREADADTRPLDEGGRSRRPRQDSSSGAPDAAAPPPPDKRAAERAERVAGGLREFDQWIADVVRTGLTAPALAQYRTWDEAAARLVDAQASSLANRVRRLAGLVGTRPAWHEHVLAELGTLHLLCRAGQRLPELDRTDPALADSVRTALGRTIRQADVLAGPAEADLWMVCGHSVALEDRFLVLRQWLRCVKSSRWALLLSFAPAGHVFDEPLRTGSVVAADLHRYPGLHELRCVPSVIEQVEVARADDAPLAGACSVAAACAEVGTAVSRVPWIERWPVAVHAAPAVVDGRWVLTDHTGSLPVVAGPQGMAPLVALSGGRPLHITGEWTPSGVLPIAVHLDSRCADLGVSVAEDVFRAGAA